MDKSIRVLCYWQQIFFKDTNQKFLYGKGFFDPSVYSSSQRSAQSLFRIEPKHITDQNSQKKSQKIPVVFGAQILIKHVVSDQYLAVSTQNGISNLQLFKQQSNQCYFVFQPAHTYQRDGDQILLQSIFQLKNIHSNLYVINNVNDLFEDAIKDKIDTLVQLQANQKFKQPVDLQLAKACTSKRIMQLRKLGQLSRTTQINKYLAHKLFSHFQQFHEIAINALHGQDYLMQMIGQSKDREFLIQKLNHLKLFTESMLKQREQIIQMKNPDVNYLANSLSFKLFIDKYGGTYQIEEKIQQIMNVLTDIQYRQSYKKEQKTTSFAFNQNLVPIFEQDIHTTSLQDYAEKLQSKKNLIIKERDLIVANYPKQISKMFYQLLILDLITRLPEIMIKKNFKEPMSSKLFKEKNDPISRVGFKSDAKVLSFVDKQSIMLGDIQQGDFIYLVHSKNKQIVTVNYQKGRQTSQLISATDSNIPMNSVFQVKNTGQTKSVYLQHVLTGNYFSHSDPNMSFIKQHQAVKYKVSFKPLYVSGQTKLLQPYKIQLNGMLFDILNQKKNLGHHGYWVKKYPRKNISQMLSMEGMQLSLILPNIMNYLKNNSSEKQKLLIDFQLFDYILMILQTQTEGQILHQSIKIFFKICEENSEAKQKGKKIIPIILRKNNRLNFLDIIAQLLHGTTLQEYSSQQVGKQMLDYLIKQFVQQGQYEARFLQIFRLLCGSQSDYNKNQAYIFKNFYEVENSAVPQRFKFRLVYGQKENVLITNNQIAQPFYSFEINQKQYIRQYFYLLADCLRDNERDIYDFIVDFPEEILIDILLQQRDLAGPILSLYAVAYLQPFKDLTMGIHHPSYQGIYNKGKLICNKNDELTQKFRNFISRQITQNRQRYSTTLYRYLLYVFQLSIKNGFWPEINLLFVLSKQIQIIYEADQSQQFHDNFEDKLAKYNLIQNKLRVTIIKEQIMQIQINLWISQLLFSQQQQINEKVKKYTKQWNFRSSVKLCETKNQQIKRRTLTLLHKVYNLSDYIHEKYQIANKQLASTETIRMQLSDMNYHKKLTSPNDYFTIIRTCIPQVKMKQLTKQFLRSRGLQALSSAFYYFQTNQQVQNIHFKRGLHLFLIQKVIQFTQMSFKERKIAQDIIYWILLTIFALIKDNINGRKILSQNRSIFLPFLEDKQENMLYYVAVDIIEEIYRNNRRLIISGSKQQIKHVCEALQKTMFDQSSATLKDCKLISLLRVFIEAGSRTVSSNFSLIIEHLFDKQRLSDLMRKAFKLTIQSSGYSDDRGCRTDRNQQSLEKQIKLTKFEKQYLNDLMSLLIYDLLSGKGKQYLRELMIDEVFLLQQFKNEQNRKLANGNDTRKNRQILRKLNTNQNHDYINIFFAKNDRINKLLLKIGKFNWNLKVRISCCISFDGPDVSKQIPQFLYGALSDLNQLCEVFKRSQQRGSRPRQLAVYTANLPRFIQILKDAFDKVIKTHPYLILKIIERLFLLKQLCTFAIKDQIKKLEKYLPQVKNCILQQIIYQNKQQQHQFSQQSKGTVLKKQSHNQNNQNQTDNSLNIDVLLWTVRTYLDKIKIQDFDTKTIKQQKEKPLVLLSYMMNKYGDNKMRKNSISYMESSVPIRKQTLVENSILNKNDRLLKYDHIQLGNDQSDILIKVFISSLKTKVQGNSKEAFVMKKFFIQFIQQKLYSHKKYKILRPKFQKTDNKLLNLTEIFKQLTRTQKMKQYQQNLVIQLPNIINSISNQGLQHIYQLRQKIFSLAIDILQFGDSENKAQLVKTFMKSQNSLVLQTIAEMIKEGLQTLNFYYNCHSGTVQQYDIALHISELQQVRQQRCLCSRFLWKIFRFFKLLCQFEQGIQIKIFLYNQDNFGSGSINMSINFIQLAINSLENVFTLLNDNVREILNHFDKTIAQQISLNLYPLPEAILDFLVTTCRIYSLDQRVLQLQLFVSRSQFFQILNNLIKFRKVNTQIKKRDDQQQLNLQLQSQQYKGSELKIKKFCFNFQRKIVILIRSLLQQNQSKITHVINQKLRKQFYQFLIKDTIAYGNLLNNQQMQRIMKNTTYNETVQNISDINIIQKTLLDDKYKIDIQYQQRVLLRNLKDQTRSIQINIQGKSHKVHFLNYPLFDKLTNNTKESFMGRALNCNSRVDKLNQFLATRSIIYSDIQTSQNTGFITEENLSLLFDATLIFGYLILIFLIFAYKVTNQGLKVHQADQTFLNWVCFQHLILTLIYCIFWGKHMTILVKSKISKMTKTRQNEKLIRNQFFDQVIYKFKLLKQIYYGQPISHHATGILLISLSAYLFDMRLYSLMLLFLFSRIQALNSILSSFSLVWRQLFVLSLLTAVCTFIFGLLSLNNYIAHLYNDEGMNCNSILECIDFIFTQDVIKKPTHREAAYYYGKYLSDGIYWAFFQILLGSVFGGLIIHKFAQQRDMRHKITEQYKSKCFICSVDSQTLQKRGQDFAKHVQQHVIWNYYRFMYKVQRRQSTDELTGIQNYILKQLKDQQIKWIPIDKASDQKVIQPQNNNSEQHLKKFEEMIQSMRSQLRQINLFQSRNRNNRPGFTQRFLTDQRTKQLQQNSQNEEQQNDEVDINNPLIQKVNPISVRQCMDIRSSDRPSMYNRPRNDFSGNDDNLAASSYYQKMPSSIQDQCFGINQN